MKNLSLYAVIFRLGVVWVGFVWQGWGQNADSLKMVQFLRREVEELCRLEGRGFAGKGYQKAARYLRRRFTEMGYGVQVDTFRHSVRYVAKAQVRPKGETPWRVGIDFWPHPAGPSLKGKFTVDTLPQAGKLWMIPETLSLAVAFRLARAHGVPALLKLTPKVSATYAQETLPILLIETSRKVKPGMLLRLSIRIKEIEAKNYNVIAKKRGLQDSLWILGAHYDHLGRVGKTIFWGANDNASGIAFLLLLADRLREAQLPNAVLFVAFGGEEVGLLGSYFFVNQHKKELATLKGMLNFDLMGFGERGIAVVGAADQVDFWQRVIGYEPEELSGVPHLLRPNAPNSDHYPFREKGYPALFFYLQGGPGYYHDPLDRPETLSWAGAWGMIRWIETLLRTSK